MLDTITNYFYPPAAPNDEAKTGEDKDTSKFPQVQVDENGRRLGLEDPNNPALIDDPSISASSTPQEPAYSAPNGQPSKTLVPSKGKAFIDPRLYGGRNLDLSAGLGEPLNVIISGLSSPELLTRKGLQSYFRSLDFDFECLGLHSGKPQQAWLDPRGWVDQVFLFREVYTPLDHLFGTCLESLVGGNHIRAWQQQGTGAWFLAVSKEEDATKHHMVVPDGYNIGRNEMVEKTQSGKPAGQTSFFGKKYSTRVEYVSGLLEVGTEGINHGIAIDGRTAILTVKLLNPSKGDKKKAVKVKENIQSTDSSMSRSNGSGSPTYGSTTQSNESTPMTTADSAQVPMGGATREKPKEQRRSHLFKLKFKKRFSLQGKQPAVAPATSVS